MLHNIIKILIIALLALFAYAGYTTIAKANNTVSLGQATAKDLLSSQANGVLVIDIRHEDEWRDTGIIEGAKTVTAFQKNGQIHPDFQQKLFSLASSKSTPILLYCRSGNRSNAIGNALITQLGFSQVSHLSTGITGWISEGYETVAFKH
jgi:rhodanese-related sulfurtransferase